MNSRSNVATTGPLVKKMPWEVQGADRKKNKIPPKSTNPITGPYTESAAPTSSSYQTTYQSNGPSSRGNLSSSSAPRGTRVTSQIPDYNPTPVYDNRREVNAFGNNTKPTYTTANNGFSNQEDTIDYPETNIKKPSLSILKSRQQATSIPVSANKR